MNKRILTVFSLTMINVVALADIRSLPISAEYGWALITYFILGAILFLLPCALVVAELATTWPRTGGVYVWVREAFGKGWGFLVVWIQWFYNVVWYPTIMTVLAVTFIYLISPDLLSNKILILALMVLLFWLITAANCFGMRISSLVSTIGTLVGAVFPLLMLTVLAAIWLIKGHPTVIHDPMQSIIPKNIHWSDLALLTGVLFSFVGIEMSATHAQEVKRPGRDYPRAILWSIVILLVILILGSLAVALVIPKHQLGLTDGVIQTFSLIFDTLHMRWMLPVMGGCIIIGGFSGVSAWVLGTAKCMMAAGKDGSLPPFLAKVTPEGTPRPMLIMQAFIFTLLCCAYLLFSQINSSYWLLSAMTSELSLLFYVLLFTAAIRLRYKRKDVPRVFKIPGGNVGMWITSCVGLAATIFVFAVGILPPSQLKIHSVLLYESILLGGILVIMLPGLWMVYRYQRTKE